MCHIPLGITVRQFWVKPIAPLTRTCCWWSTWARRCLELQDLTDKECEEMMKRWIQCVGSVFRERASCGRSTTTTRTGSMTFLLFRTSHFVRTIVTRRPHLGSARACSGELHYTLSTGERLVGHVHRDWVLGGGPGGRVGAPPAFFVARRGLGEPGVQISWPAQYTEPSGPSGAHASTRSSSRLCALRLPRNLHSSFTKCCHDPASTRSP